MDPEPTSPAGRRRPLVIPVFLPHAGCPHRCVFCNQHAVTATRETWPSERQVRERIDAYLAWGSPERARGEIAFYGGNALGLDSAQLDRLLAIARPYVDAGRVAGLRLSTRPDTVTPERLDALSGTPVRTIEVGVQSLDDRVLRRSGRGHSAQTAVEAVRRLRARGFRVGVQLMLGLPGDHGGAALETAQRVVSLQPDFVRLYPTLVLGGSPLADRYARGRYRPLSLEEAVALTQRLYVRFTRHGIPVIRMGLPPGDGLNAPGALVAGPHHPAFGELVLSACFRDMALAALSGAMRRPGRTCQLRVHPRSESRLRGCRNANLPLLERAAGGRLAVTPDPALPPAAVAVDQAPPVHLTDLEETPCGFGSSS
jgi:histone acetyltransferase (RNA polymerase elongator complex component)